jgi:hypothetical protein
MIFDLCATGGSASPKTMAYEIAEGASNRRQSRLRQCQGVGITRSTFAFSRRKVRDGEDTIASTRDARAPQNSATAGRTL